MKTLLLSTCCLVAGSVLLLGGNAEAARLNWATASDELEFRAKLDETNLDEKIKDEIYYAYIDYNAASTKFKELLELNGLNKTKPAQKSIPADLVDPTIRAIQKQAAKYRNRFEVLSKTIRKWGPSTNLFARAARQSMQSRLNETRAERDLAKADAKVLKYVQKAARKFGKNLEKVRKDFEKYRDKAATEDEASFWQSLLGIIPVPNDEDAQ